MDSFLCWVWLSKRSAMGILSAFRFAFQNLFFTPILYGVIASLAVFSTVWDNGDRFKDQLTDRFRSQDDTFDFIIGKQIMRIKNHEVYLKFLQKKSFQFQS